MRAEIALMSGSAFAVTHHAFSSGAGRTSDGNGSHASTSKSPSYTKSVSWEHYLIAVAGARIWVQNHVDFSQNGNLIMVATTLVLGAGDFTLKIGQFTLGGIGTATFGAIILNAVLRRRSTTLTENKVARQDS